MHMPVRAVRVQGVEHSPNPTPNPKQGVEHMVIGTSEDRPGIRNGHALRSFLMDAFRFALSETLEHAWARAHPERSPAPPGPKKLEQGICASDAALVILCKSSF